jgi:hypothetical protein
MGTLLVFTTFEVVSTASVGFQFDFIGDLYDAAHAILRGANPYHPHVLSAEASTLRAGGHLGWIASPRYPPLMMLAVIPLSFLTPQLAGILFMLLSAGAVVGALVLLGVRDWRCMAIGVLSSPTVFGVWIGNVSAVLLLGAAVMWRVRSRANLVVLAAAATIGAKLFMWPLGLWFLATRRYTQFAATAVLTIVGVLAAWAVIGFKGLVTYPEMLLDVAFIGERRGSSLVTLLLQIGLSVPWARALALSGAALLGIAAYQLAPRPDGDRRAFGLAVMAALIASPVVWLHALILVFIPIALVSPRLSLLWFVPILASFSPLTDVLIEFVVIAQLCSPLVVRPVASDASLGRHGRIRRGEPPSLLTPL